MFADPDCRRLILGVLAAAACGSEPGAGGGRTDDEGGLPSDGGAEAAIDGARAEDVVSGLPDDGSLDTGLGRADAASDAPVAGLAFPPGFVFGSAIAGFQADMGCPTLARAKCDDPNSDWYVFTTTPELIADTSTHLSGQNPSIVGPGFWELYPEDIRRADEELHHRALRLSLEWSRIFPAATDAASTFDDLKKLANPDALARYHAIFAELKRRGMRPMVTLYHYSLPTWIHDAKGCHADLGNCSPKGWVDHDRTVREAAKYAGFCAAEFGAEVDWWATLNEPLQNMLFGYVQPSDQRAHPPAVFLQTDAAKVVFRALIDAHARMYDAVKQYDKVDADGDGQASFVGVVYPMVPIEPANPGWFLDVNAAKDIDYLWNRAYLNAVVRGKYDENLDGNTVDRADLAGRMDYVGINWYSGIRVTGTGVALPPISSLSPKFTANPLNVVETPNQPERLAEFLSYVNGELGLPAIISENGTGDPSDDGSGSRFLVRNLKAVAEAARAGADVRGYFYWTLMDNYEWNHGMNIRMGLYAVDKDDSTKRRVARKSVAVYGEIARTGVLSNELLDMYARGD
jgi:beta-galactosidase